MGRMTADASQPDGAEAIDERSLADLLTDLRFLAQENGRLRAERDLIRQERDRLVSWLETDRELTRQMFTALESEVRALRAALERAPDRLVPRDTPSPPVATDPGPSLRTGLGRRFRDRGSDPS